MSEQNSEIAGQQEENGKTFSILISCSGCRRLCSIEDVGQIPSDQSSTQIDSINLGAWRVAVACTLVLDGFVLRSEVKVVKLPDRYVDKRRVAMWERVTRLLAGVETR